ncbi:MAG: hypothetical protein AAGD25_06755 [Cyanobacteria bacterium P01_F01_bin.150]
MTTYQEISNLVGQMVTLAGREAIVKQWAAEHPMARESKDDNQIAGPIEMEGDPNGWFRVSLTPDGYGQWWRHGMLINHIAQSKAP